MLNISFGGTVIALPDPEVGNRKTIVSRGQTHHTSGHEVVFREVSGSYRLQTLAFKAVHVTVIRQLITKLMQYAGKPIVFDGIPNTTSTIQAIVTNNVQFVSAPLYCKIAGHEREFYDFTLEIEEID